MTLHFHENDWSPHDGEESAAASTIAELEPTRGEFYIVDKLTDILRIYHELDDYEIAERLETYADYEAQNEGESTALTAFKIRANQLRASQEKEGKEGE